MTEFESGDRSAHKGSMGDIGNKETIERRKGFIKGCFL